MALSEEWATIVLLAGGGKEMAHWPLMGEERPDLGTVDLLARLALAARRAGCSIQVRGACGELEDLLDLAGLWSEVIGEPEGGKEVGVEEVVVADDPVA